MDIDKLIIRPVVKEKILEEIKYYHDIDEELSKRFFNEIDVCLGYIENNPYLFQKRYGEIRVCFTKVFPFGIYYVIKETPKLKKKRIYVINLLHTSKKTRYKNTNRI